MKTLTVAIFGKNEEEVLGRGLESLKGIVDEIIYTDTGGTDGSVEIAKSYGAKIYSFPWINDFGKAYTFTNSKVTSDYILMWDTDFVLDEGSREDLIKLKENDFDGLDSISLKWGLEYDEKTGELQKYVYRDILNKAGAYEIKRSCHVKISFFNKNAKKANRDILVHHHQKHNGRMGRKDQNIELTLKDIENDPSDYILYLALAETYFYIKEYQKSFVAIEKLFTFKDIDFLKRLVGFNVLLKCCIALNKIDFCFKLFGSYYDMYKNEPSYILLCADLMYFIDKRESLNLYVEYVRVRHKKGIHEQDIFRNTKHPENMIEKIKSEIT